mgnify:CR=1 FL=1
MTNFHVRQEDKKTFARLGRLDLKHGALETPVFMPVGTYGTVRGISSFELRSTDSPIMLANTYHMYVRAGTDLIGRMGGLHSFIGWDRPILTDSGGFQIFSLAQQRKITDEGVTFKNPENGDTIHLNPEKVVQIQECFGSDVMMVLDECPPATATPFEVKEAVERTTRWAERARAARSRSDLALFPIIQGGSIDELRRKSLRDLLQLEVGRDPWEGIAIGGMSVGEEKMTFVRTLHALRGVLPTDRPHYLMGVGTPRDLVFAVSCGVDMFDCVLPSRNGRHGIVMTRHGRLNLFNAQYQEDKRPIDENCRCDTCKNYSRAFLRHLLMIGDALGGRLATLHNIVYFLDLMHEIRGRIADGSFSDFAKEFLEDPKNIFLGVEKTVESYPEAGILALHS